MLCPQTKVKWSYAELWHEITSLAGGLKTLGYQQGDVIATDTDHSVSNVLLQLAASHNGMKVLTSKSAGEFDKLSQLVPVKGAVMANSSSFLSKASLPMKHPIAEITGKAPEGITDRKLGLAYYNTADEIANRTAYIAGIGINGLLEMKHTDTVCVAMSTNSLVGIGSVVSAFVCNATVHIPDMSKLDLGDSTFVITDEANVDKVRAAMKKGSKLRGGVIKQSGGDDVLLATEKVGDLDFRLLGSGSDSETMRPLYNACVDTYYSFK